MQILSDRFLNPNVKSAVSRNQPVVSKQQAVLKKDNLSFKNSCEFLNLAEDEIRKLVSISVKNPENLLGRGGEAAVYRIEGTKYCARVPHKVNKPEYKSDFRLNFALTPRDEINHTIAKLGNDITIMPIINGYNFFSRNVTKYQVASMIDNMPQTAFDELFDQLYKAQRFGMRFDSSWSNVIINPELKSITAIDFYKTQNPGGLISGMSLALNYQGVTSDTQLKNINRKVLTSFIKSVEKGENPKLRLSELNVVGSMVDDIRYSRVIAELFRQIQDLNSWKHFGGNIASELNGKLKVAKSLIKQLF